MAIFRDSDGTVRLQGDLLAPGGATGDVLTQQADGTYAPDAVPAGLPDEWTVAANGSLQIEAPSGTAAFQLGILGEGDTGLTVETAETSPGEFQSTLALRATQAGSASLSVDNQTAQGETAVLNGYGGLALFTVAGQRGIEAWDGAGNVLRFGLTVTGAPMVGVTAAPADGDLSANQLALWFDSTDGAAKLKLKGKSADGTVVTGTVNLA